MRYNLDLASKVILTVRMLERIKKPIHQLLWKTDCWPFVACYTSANYVYHI